MLTKICERLHCGKSWQFMRCARLQTFIFIRRSYSAHNIPAVFLLTTNVDSIWRQWLSSVSLSSGQYVRYQRSQMNNWSMFGACFFRTYDWHFHFFSLNRNCTKWVSTFLPPASTTLSVIRKCALFPLFWFVIVIFCVRLYRTRKHTFEFDERQLLVLAHEKKINSQTNYYINYKF